MDTSILKRHAVINQSESGESNSLLKLASDAQEKLGYRTLMKQIGLVGVNGMRLREALDRLDIQPFVLESVKAYKQEAQREGYWCGRNPMVAKLLLALPWCAEVALIYCLYLTDHAAYAAGPIAYAHYWDSMVPVGLILSPVACIVLGVSLLFTIPRRMRGAPARGEFGISGWHWSRFGLSTYELPIPEFVLRKAIAIQKAYPNAKFMIDSLVDHTQILYADPFLVVLDGDEEYYIEVWDEPKFESKLLT